MKLTDDTYAFNSFTIFNVKFTISNNSERCLQKFVKSHYGLVILSSVKIESLSEITPFGLKMMLKSGLDFFFKSFPFKKYLSQWV